jgi:CheY-like chemotaxis protein
MNPEGFVMIIDDDVDYSCLLQVALQQAGVAHPVEIFNDSVAAVHCLAQSALLTSRRGPAIPALVLLDLKMPRLSGLEVLRWIRAQPHLATIPVVLLTGLPQDDEYSLALALGATSLREKPFSYGELVQEVSRLRDSYLQPEHLKHAA